MTDYIIKENQNNLKSKNRFFNDSYLKILIDYIRDYEGFFNIHKFIRNFLYLKSKDEYEILFSKSIMVYKEHYEIIFKIFTLFTNWIPYEKYNLGELRGNFLEFLSYNYLNDIYDKSIIYQESNIILKEYKSHTWDIIVDSNQLLLYECKFSSLSLKRSHINKMIGLKNKFEKVDIFLVFYESKLKVKNNIENLQENTKKYKFNDMLTEFNYITLENFSEKNPFIVKHIKDYK